MRSRQGPGQSFNTPCSDDAGMEAEVSVRFLLTYRIGTGLSVAGPSVAKP